MESSTLSPGPDPGIAFLQCLHVRKGYGDGHGILRDVQLQVHKGDTVCIVGDNGCGKTTLVRLLFGLDIPDSGQVAVDGVNPSTLDPGKVIAFRRRVSVVFQDLKLVGQRTVHSNVALPLVLSGKGKDFIDAMVDRSLRRIDLHQKSSLSCSGLSLGERQLVAMARAMVNDPVILLADEPTSHLDDAGVRKVSAILADLRRRGTTILVTTKDTRLPRLLPSPRLMQLASGRIVEETPFPPRRKVQGCYSGPFAESVSHSDGRRCPEGLN